jgi:hypothetical protein
MVVCLGGRYCGQWDGERCGCRVGHASNRDESSHDVGIEQRGRGSGCYKAAQVWDLGAPELPKGRSNGGVK